MYSQILRQFSDIIEILWYRCDDWFRQHLLWILIIFSLISYWANNYTWEHASDPMLEHYNASVIISMFCSVDDFIDYNGRVVVDHIASLAE